MFLCLQVPTNPIAHQVFVCQSVCLFVFHSGDGGPHAIALILIKVFCVRKVCVCVYFVFLCMLCFITEGGVVKNLFLLLQLCSDLY